MFNSKLKAQLDALEKTNARLRKENEGLVEKMDKIVAGSMAKLDKLEYGRKYYPGQVFHQEEHGLLSDPENIREIAEAAQSPRLQFILYDFREKWLADRTRDPHEFIGGLEAIDRLKRLLLSYAIAYGMLAEAKEGGQ